MYISVLNICCERYLGYKTRLEAKLSPVLVVKDQILRYQKLLQRPSSGESSALPKRLLHTNRSKDIIVNVDVG